MLKHLGCPEVAELLQVDYLICEFSALVRMYKGLSNQELKQFFEERDKQKLHRVEVHLLLERCKGDARKVLDVIAKQRVSAVLWNNPEWREFKKINKHVL